VTEEIAARVQRIAESFLGRPYVSHPLIGGPDRPEELVTDTSAFDCVTLVETVLAQARSPSPADFERELIQLRYRNGTIAWEERLHYFSDWFLENERRGVLAFETAGPGAQSIEARLAILEGLPPRTARFDVVPPSMIDRALPRLANGSIVAFASEREGLDYFHVGLVFLEDQPMMVHAAKSVGSVGKEPLAAFLARNTTRGISFARPLEPRRTS
jgi:hypothetical protein